MRRFWMMVLLLFCVCAPAWLHADSLSRAEVFFEQGRLADGRSLLLEALQTSADADPETRARIMNRLARFYENLVGSPEDALRYARQVRGLPLGKDHPEGLARG